jgi:protein CMS1
MKVDEQVSFLKNKKTGIGVGTPARLTELIDNGKAYTPPVHWTHRERERVDRSHNHPQRKGTNKFG